MWVIRVVTTLSAGRESARVCAFFCACLGALGRNEVRCEISIRGVRAHRRIT